MNLMGILQQLGRSLILPMIALPAAAVLLRLGAFHWETIGLESFGHILSFSGDAIFTFLPYIFAVGVALGLTENASIAGMSALLGYYIFREILLHFAEGIELGISGGIFIGLTAALSHHLFKKVKFHESIQFFGGSRFVPLFMCFAGVILSYPVIVIAPHIQVFAAKVGQFILDSGHFGVFVYGVLYRLLVPSGLHHILNNIVWFQVGTFERADGQFVSGDLPRFFAGDPTAGAFMAGLYPIMMFAIPAIALAIIHEAREDLKPKIMATFFIAAFTSFLTGITEPIEFAFLFVAPFLFFIHAILSGLSMWIVSELGIHHGFAYSAGAIDYLINFHLATKGWLLIPIGLVYGFVYYVMFRFAIRRFRIPTPGREEGSPLEEWAGDIRYQAPLIIQALGGKENILQNEACITRLRLTLANDRLLDIAALRNLGAAGVIRLGGGNVQVVFGTYSELIREEIVKALRKDFEQIIFSSPVHGRMIPLDEVPDRVFADKIVGEGVAFIPDRGELVAPIAGVVSLIYPSMHALGMRTHDGLDVLLHIGIDTSDLPGRWFTAVVKEGDEVQPGQPLIRFDIAKIKKHSKSMATPMIITNPDMVKSWSFAPYKAVRRGQGSIMSVILKEVNASGGKMDD